MPLNYFLASIIVYLGLLLGVILIKLAPEEQRPGKKYFSLLKKIILFLIITLFFAYSNLNYVLLLFLIAVLFLILLSKKITLESTILIYLLFGVIFSLSSKITNLFVIESVLIFLYGIPTASLIFKIKKKNYYDVFARNLLFFLPVILIYFFL